jgi:hypothetical protein
MLTYVSKAYIACIIKDDARSVHGTGSEVGAAVVYCPESHFPGAQSYNYHYIY